VSDEDSFDAAAAARRATGNARETVEDGATNQARAEGADVPTDPVGSESTLRSMLMSTDPSPNLADVENPFDPERGGTTRIYRGVMKATGVDGLPAIADVVIGVVEFSQTFNLDEEIDDREDDQDDAVPGEQEAIL
jgi:hypothetical protein